MMPEAAGGSLVVARTLEAWRPRPSKWREEDETVGLDRFGWLDGESRDDSPDADPGTIVGHLDDEALELIVAGILPFGNYPHTVTGLERLAAVGRDRLFHDRR